MGSELLSIIYGLVSAASWGAGDFSGGLATKRTPVYSVIIISQLVGCSFLLALALLFEAQFPAARFLLFGSMAGICGASGLAALYRGLATGQMGVVGPVAAVVSAILPVVVSMFSEGLPAFHQIIGFFLAIIAVWFLSRGNSKLPIRLAGLKLPVAAGIGFGVFFILIDQVSHESVLWPLISARITSVSLFIVIASLGRKRIVPGRDQLPLIALAGFFDTGGNAFYALASSVGRLDISVIISSLYPAVTVLLAWLILKERLAPVQWVGVGAALLALALIAM